MNPLDTVWWHHTEPNTPSLKTAITADVVIVGGGMAGMSAAQACAQRGIKAVLLEKNYIGSGASGKSSGFITPDSEISLRDLISGYGPEQAKKIWHCSERGVQTIYKTIQDYQLSCDYMRQDTMVVANEPADVEKMLREEYKARAELGYESTMYGQSELEQTMGVRGYFGGIRYPGSFGINGYRYLQGLKKQIQGSIDIFEDSPVIRIEGNTVITPEGSVKAKHIILTPDYAITQLGLLTEQIYHVQTYLMMSAPLSPDQIKKLFPGEQYMVWDTQMVYSYFRLSGDRLLLGGASLLTTYAKQAHHDNTRVAHTIIDQFNRHAPDVNPTMRYMWPGLIGVSKDLLPLAGRVKENSAIYAVAGCAGLPFASSLGHYAIEHLFEGRTDLDALFNPYRAYRIQGIAQTLLGTRLTFALSHFLRVGSL